MITEKSLSSLDHEKLMRRAIALSVSAKEKGNDPFGALLANLDGEIVLEAENTAGVDSDATSHAEQNLMSKASRTFSKEELAQLVLYTSSEPCAMCAGAIFFAGVRAVVFGLSEPSLRAIWTSDDVPNPALLKISCRTIFSTCESHPTVVVGPMMEELAAQPQYGGSRA